MGFISMPKGPSGRWMGARMTPPGSHNLPPLLTWFSLERGLSIAERVPGPSSPPGTEHYFSVPMISCHIPPAAAHKTMCSNNHFVNLVLYFGTALGAGTTCSFFFIFEHPTPRPSLSYCRCWVFEDKRVLCSNRDTEQRTPQLPGSV